MPLTAKQFQVVLNIVKQWHRSALHNLLVNGQLAIEDYDYSLIEYVSLYCSKPVDLTFLRPYALMLRRAQRNLHNDV